MAKAERPNRLMADTDLKTIQDNLDASKDELLLEDSYSEEEDDDDTLSNGSLGESQVLISLKEEEVGIDEIMQTELKGSDLERLLRENESLKAELAENKVEIIALKDNIARLEKISIEIQDRFEVRIASLETEKSKSIDCNLAKALKRDIKETKDVIASIQQEKFDKRTTDKKSEKFSAKKLDEISFEIIDLQDQIRKHNAEHENLKQFVNGLKRSMKDNRNTEENKNDSATKTAKTQDQHENDIVPQHENDIVPQSFSPDIDSTRPKAELHQTPFRMSYGSERGSQPRSFFNNHAINKNISNYIIGDSILKQLHPRKLDSSGSTKVRTLSGRSLEEIRAALSTHDLSSIKNLIIHAGTNNIPKQNGPEIVQLFDEMICEIKSSYPNLKIYLSTIIQREDLKIPGSKEKITFINEKLKSMAQKLNIEIIDNAPNLNDPELRYDGLHLNGTGVIELARNFKNAILPQRRKADYRPSHRNIDYSDFSFRKNAPQDARYNNFEFPTHKTPEASPNQGEDSNANYAQLTPQNPLHTRPGQYHTQWLAGSMQPPRNTAFQPIGSFPYPWNNFGIPNGMVSPFAYHNRHFGMPVPVF